MADAEAPNRSGRRYLLPVNRGVQCESAFSYLLRTAQPEDTINLIHVIMKPDQTDNDTNVESPSYAVLRRQGKELCDEFRERAREAGLNTKVWVVFGANVAETVISWSDTIGTDWIVIGLNRGNFGQGLWREVVLELKLKSDKPLLIVPTPNTYLSRF